MRKDMKKIITILLPAAMLLFASCEKNQDFQKVVEAPTTLVYIADGGIDNAQSSRVVVLPDGYITVDKYFQANVNSSLHGATTATLTLAPDAVKDYNAKNGTSYAALPAGNVSLTAYLKPASADGSEGQEGNEGEESFVSSSKATVNIAENERLSTEKFHLQLGGDLSALTEKNYLVAFALTCPDLTLSTKRNVYYLLVTFTEELVKKVTATSEMVGTQISNNVRKNFTADVASYSSLFDNSTSSAVSFNSTGNVVTVDMLTEYKFSGISLRGANYIYPYIMKVEVSKDGENFTSMGEVGEDNYFMNSYQCYSSLITGIGARYVRVTFDFYSPYASYGATYKDRLAEIYIYAEE